MARYEVTLNEVWTRVFEVEANNEQDAQQFVLEGQDCAEEVEEMAFSHLLDSTVAELDEEIEVDIFPETLRDCDD